MLTLSLDQNSRTSNGTYVFSCQPRVVQQRSKYRQNTADAAFHLPYTNLMFDKRVERGNALANSRTTKSAYQSLNDSRKNTLSNKKQFHSGMRTTTTKRTAWSCDTPEPVEGRQHIKLQTELYLEELSGYIEEADASCQTDPFLGRPPTPLFIPAKTGMDQETQIYEGELFDFDLEVQPILEVLVGKVVEQALIEVMEEEELASLREKQKIFEEMREAELQEQQRLEEVERRRKEEKLMRMKQQQERIKQEKETAKKVAAKVFAQNFVANLVPSVIASLSENGFFHDPVEREIETVFFPRLLKNVRKNLTTHMTARKLLDGLIRETIIRRMSQEAKTGSEDKVEDIPAGNGETEVKREDDVEETTGSEQDPDDDATKETEDVAEETARSQRDPHGAMKEEETVSVVGETAGSEPNLDATKEEDENLDNNDENKNETPGSPGRSETEG